MGILIQSIIETTAGEIENSYVVVSSYKVLKSTYEIQYSVRYFSEKKHWKQTLAETVEDIGKQPSLPNNAIFPTNSVLFEKKGEFIDVALPTFFSIIPTKTKNIKIPIFEQQEKEVLQPYVSFNKKGEEVILERKVISSVSVKVDEKIEKKELIDYKAFEDPTKFIYSHLKKELKSILPGVKLKDD